MNRFVYFAVFVMCFLVVLVSLVGEEQAWENVLIDDGVLVHNKRAESAALVTADNGEILYIAAPANQLGLWRSYDDGYSFQRQPFYTYSDVHGIRSVYGVNGRMSIFFLQATHDDISLYSFQVAPDGETSDVTVIGTVARGSSFDYDIARSNPGVYSIVLYSGERAVYLEYSPGDSGRFREERLQGIQGDIHDSILFEYRNTHGQRSMHGIIVAEKLWGVHRDAAGSIQLSPLVYDGSAEQLFLSKNHTESNGIHAWVQEHGSLTQFTFQSSSSSYYWEQGYTLNTTQNLDFIHHFTIDADQYVLLQKTEADSQEVVTAKLNSSTDLQMAPFFPAAASSVWLLEHDAVFSVIDGERVFLFPTSEHFGVLANQNGDSGWLEIPFEEAPVNMQAGAYVFDNEHWYLLHDNTGREIWSNGTRLFTGVIQ